MISSSWKPLSGRSKSTVFVAHLGRGVHRLQNPVARCHGASNFHFCRASPSFLLAVWSPHPSPAASSTCSTIPCIVDSKNPACKADATSGAHQSAAVAEPLCATAFAHHCTPLYVPPAACTHIWFFAGGNCGFWSLTSHMITAANSAVFLPSISTQNPPPWQMRWPSVPSLQSC